MPTGCRVMLCPASLGLQGRSIAVPTHASSPHTHPCRPKALNSLDTDMVEGLSELLGSWTAGPASHAVACVIVKGAGEKVWRTGVQHAMQDTQSTVSLV